MAPGGNSYKMGSESRMPVDCGITPENGDFRSSPHRKVGVVTGGKVGTPLKSAVQDLLECPICLNIMYPPIHQVGSLMVFLVKYLIYVLFHKTCLYEFLAKLIFLLKQFSAIFAAL